MTAPAMNRDQREFAKTAALWAARNIPNGPTSGALQLAADGGNEDLLLAVHLIIKRMRNLAEHG